MVEQKQSASIAQIRQACMLGLPSRTFVPMVIREIKKLVPAACGQFTWSTESGRLANFWSDSFMPRRTAWIIMHHKQYEKDAGFSFQDVAMFGRTTGNCRAWWNNSFETTKTFAAVFRPYHFKWFLDAVVRDGVRPYGVLALIRHEEDADFSPDEEECVRQVLPYIAHGFRTSDTRLTKFVSTGNSALIVCNCDGSIVEWSDLAHRLAVYALVDRINLDAPIAADEFDEMKSRLRDLALTFHERLSDSTRSDVPSYTCRNGWGEFTFRGYRLTGAGEPRVGILVEQLAPLEAHLLDNINKTSLSVRQKEVVLLSLRGMPNGQIASRMGIKPLTLKDYWKAIYARLEINSHQELEDRFSH